jgi:hypothetical protein
MEVRLPHMLLMVSCLLGAASRAAAEDPSTSDLKLLSEAVRKVVQKHYPKGTVILKDQTIHFEFNTRKFMIHEPLKSGEWQDAHEEVGPQKGGIHGTIELRAGKYGGTAVVPQSFDQRYFTLLLKAPYSERLDRHLYIHLKYPRDVPKEFLKEFEGVVDGFEKHIPTTGK